MTTYVWREDCLVLKSEAAPLFGVGPRSDMACPMVISDAMDDLRGMHNGKIYDSKSHLRKSYKDHGYIEVGDQAPRTNTPIEKPNIKEDIVNAYKKVKNGYRPAPLESGVLPD